MTDKTKWTKATDDDFEKIVIEPKKPNKDTPTVIPELHLPGLAQRRTVIPGLAQRQTVIPGLAQRRTVIPELAQRRTVIPELAQRRTILPSGMLEQGFPGGVIPEDEFGDQGRYYQYTGTAEYVEIPHRINGEVLTSYNNMFRDNTTVKAVKSTNPDVTDMSLMFYGFQGEDLDLTELDVSNVTDMGYMFYDTSNLKSIDITGWDTSKVEDFAYFLKGTDSLKNINLEWLNTISMTNMIAMFEGTGLKDLDLRHFDTSRVTTMRDTFKLTNLDSLDLSSFDVLNIGATGFDYIFLYTNINELDLSSFNFDSWGRLIYFFNDTWSISMNINKIYARNNVDKSKIVNSLSFDKNIPVIVGGKGQIEPNSHLDIVDTYEDTKEEPILYENRTILNDKLNAGETNTLVEGKDGKKIINRQVTEYSNGVQHYDYIDEEIVEEPIDKETELGTRILDENFILATDDDFDTSGWMPKYIGNDALVEIPHTINGEPVTRMPSFEGTNVMGVKSTNPNITEIMMTFEGHNSPILDISRIDFSGVEMMEEIFGHMEVNYTLLNASTLDLSHSGEWVIYRMFGIKADVLDLRGTKFPEGAIGVFEMSDIKEILVLSEEEKDIIWNLAYGEDWNNGDILEINYLENTRFTIKPFVSIVDEYEEIVEEELPYETITTEDPELKIDTTEVDIEGVDGLKELTYLITEYSDGNIERELIGEEVIREPVKEEKRIGTNTVERITWTEEEEVVEYKTERIADDTMPEGREVVQQEGADGLVSVLYKHTHHYDGTIDVEAVERTVLEEVVNKVVIYGTAKVKSITEVVEEDVVKYQSIRTPSENLFHWQPDRVSQKGQDGLYRRTYEVIEYYDGQIDKILIKEEEVVELKTEIIEYGIKLESNTRIDDEPIPYETELVEAEHLMEGTRKVIQSGKAGYHRKVYKLTILQSGELIEELDFEQTIEPIKRIIYVGTQKHRHWVTEIYMMSPREDREYFVDKYLTNPIGISEKYGITLAERPIIPTAELRHDSEVIHGKLGSHYTEDNYEDIEITLRFNYIDTDGKNAREIYNEVANAIGVIPKGTRVRFSDDKDTGFFRELARTPIIEELNNDIYNWGDFAITLILKPFRYIEEKEHELVRNVNTELKQPLPNAMKTPQTIEHLTERGIDITVRKNNQNVYTIADAFDTPVVISDTNILHTYGGDKEW